MPVSMLIISAKTSHFPRRFSYRSRRGGNLPPAKTATPFSLIFLHNVRNIIAAKPRRILKSDSLKCLAFQNIFIAKSLISICGY